MTIQPTKPTDLCRLFICPLHTASVDCVNTCANSASEVNYEPMRQYIVQTNIDTAHFILNLCTVFLQHVTSKTALVIDASEDND